MNHPIADTNVLVAFSSVNRVDILKKLFDGIIVPSAVFNELIPQGMGWEQAAAIQACILNEESWIEVINPRKRGITLPYDLNLDPGETEVIAIAMTWNRLALLDEIPARRIAHKNKIAFMGSLGLLRISKERGILDTVKPIVHAMKAQGIRFSEPLIETFLRSINE